MKDGKRRNMLAGGNGGGPVDLDPLAIAELDWKLAAEFGAIENPTVRMATLSKMIAWFKDHFPDVSPIELHIAHRTAKAWIEGLQGGGEGGELRFPAYIWCAAEDLPRLDWISGRWFLRGAVTLVVAAGGVGKTSFLAAAVLSIVSGRPLLRKPVYGGAKSVAFWGLEDDQEQLARQIAATCIAHGLVQDDIPGRLYVSSALGGLDLPPQSLVTARQDGEGFRLVESQFEAIEAALRRQGIDMLVIDPFVSSHHARENETEAMDRIVKRWSLLAKRCNVSVALVHHTRKTNGEKAGIDAVRGSIAGVNAARAVLLLNRMTEDEAAAFGIDDQERRRMFSVDLGKANRSAPEAVEWYRMASISLGNGGEHAADEVGAVMPWSPPSIADDFTGMQLEMVRTALTNGEHRASAASPSWAGHAIGAAVGIDAKSDAGAARIKLLIRTWLDEGKLAKVMRYSQAARKEFAFIELGAAAWFPEADQ